MRRLIEEFTTYLKTVKKTSDNTIASYSSDLLRMSEYMEKVGVQSVGDIGEDKLSGYIASLRNENYQTSSVTRHITSIKAFFRFLVDNGDISDNPAEKIKSPKADKVEPRVMSSFEIEALMGQDFGDSPQGKRDKAILEIMYATGLKVSETIELKLENIDMSIGCLRMDDGRLIPYGQKAKEALNQYLLDARSMLVTGETDRVFVNYSGEPMSRQGLWKLIKKYVKRAGIDQDISPNDLRHSFGVHLIESGANASAVQEMMGYSGVNSLKRYIGKNTRSKDPYEWARIRN